MGSSKIFQITKLSLVMIIVTLCINEFSEAVDTASLPTQCSQSIQELYSCLNFATGSSPTPEKKCCDSVGTMKEKQPVCLCFFIEQAHNGSQQIKSLGIKEDNLLQLPNVCHLTNASVSNCPKLLGIPATSPAAAIFKDSNGTSSTTASPSTSSSTTSTTDNGNNANGVKHGNVFLSSFLAVFMSAIILCALPIGTFF
ncbi:unnamed protein product [Amaranthus hypochondriacus]